MSKSASSLYLFVSIEPISEVFKTGYSDSNSFNWSAICFFTLSLILGLSVSALSNTPLAYVRLGISMTASVKDFFKSILG